MLAEENWQNGDWMHTYSGKKFYPMRPDIEDISILDIAHALSMQCRYNGHVTKFYSVAQHCVLMARYLGDEGYSRETQLWALLHDATEAYVGDMIRPLKRSMPAYVAAEDAVMSVIAEKYGLEGTTMPAIVKDADNRILLNERAALMVPTSHRWAVDHLEPLRMMPITPWTPEQAKASYLNEFAWLTYGN